MPDVSEWPLQQSKPLHSAMESSTSRVSQSLLTDPEKMETPLSA